MSIIKAEGEILEALGLKGKPVLDLQISLSYGSLPQVTVTYEVPTEDLASVARVLKQYQIEMKEKP